MIPVQRKRNSPSSRCLCTVALACAFVFQLAAAAEASSSGDAAPPAEATPVNAPTTETPASAVEPQHGFFDPLFDVPREYVSEKLVDFISGVDSFFGSASSFQESNKSVIQYDLTSTVNRNGIGNVVPSFRAKLHLPHVQEHLRRFQKQLHLLLESNPEQNQSQNAAGGATQPGRPTVLRELSTPDSYGASLRLENDDTSLWHLSADAGLKLDNISLRPFVRSRASFAIQPGLVQFKMAESVFWFDTIGAGESTQFDVDYHFSDPLLFRASSGATWMHNAQNFDLRQDFDLFQTLDEHASLLYQVSAIGVSNPQAQVTEYVALLRHRQLIHRDWLFLELSPQLHYLRVYDYQLNSLFIARLEILFAK